VARRCLAALERGMSVLAGRVRCGGSEAGNDVFDRNVSAIDGPGRPIPAPPPVTTTPAPLSSSRLVTPRP